jgi:hypothetical protein
MGLMNRALGIIEYAGYNYALHNVSATYEDSYLVACAFMVGGSLAFSEFVSRTLFNSNSYKMLTSDLEEQSEKKYVGLEALNKIEMNSLKF